MTTLEQMERYNNCKQLLNNEMSEKKPLQLYIDDLKLTIEWLQNRLGIIPLVMINDYN